MRKAIRRSPFFLISILAFYSLLFGSKFLLPEFFSEEKADMIWSVAAISLLVAVTYFFGLLFYHYRNKINEILALRAVSQTWQAPASKPAHVSANDSVIHLMANAMAVLINLTFQANSNQTGGPGFLFRPNRKLIFKGKNQRKHIISPIDINWVGANGKYQVIHTDDKDFEVAESMSSIESKLSNASPDFMMIHRSNIVNIHKVDTIEAQCNHVRINGDLISVGNSYKEAFLARFEANVLPNSQGETQVLPLAQTA